MITHYVLCLPLFFLTSLAWRFGKNFTRHFSPFLSYAPYHSCGAWLWLSISPPCGKLNPVLRRPIVSVAFVYLGNTLPLSHYCIPLPSAFGPRCASANSMYYKNYVHHLIERRHIYSPSVFCCVICSTTPIGMCFSILRIR
jgi:hypothetical protein